MIYHSNGIDILEVGRLERAVLKNGYRLLRRIFRDNEINYCARKINKYQHLAARFAAKEAFFKALKTNKIRWKDVEIYNKDWGEPYIRLHGTYSSLVKEEDISVSLSHSKGYAIAVVTILRR
jgi:holo-[acyl-carrier protein] synthase